MRRFSLRRGAVCCFRDGDDAGERFGQHTLDCLVARDEDSPEEGLVVRAAKRVGCASVSLVAVLGESDRVVQVLFEHFELGFEGAEPVADDGHLPIHSFLFLGVQLARDGAVEVCVEQFPASVHKAGLLGQEHLLRAFCLRRTSLHGGLQTRLCHGRAVGRERDQLVQVLNLSLNIVDVDGGHRAVRSLLMAPDADEVRIDHSRRILGVVNDESTLASSAEDGAFQIVIVDTGLLSSRS
nr:hypothetical protein [Microbacterium testaceum]